MDESSPEAPPESPTLTELPTHPGRRIPRRWIIAIVAIIAVAGTAGIVSLVRQGLAVYDITSEAMEPTLMGHEEGGISHTGVVHTSTVHDRVLVEREAIAENPPKFGEIIVFRAPKRADVSAKMRGEEPKENDLVSRIVGLPGDVIEIKGDEQFNRRVFRNGRAIEEPYLARPMSPIIIPQEVFGTSGPLKLGSNEYFVMGDNRLNSNDSRFWGPLTRDRILGRVTAIIAPADRAKELP